MKLLLVLLIATTVYANANNEKDTDWKSAMRKASDRSVAIANLQVNCSTSDSMESFRKNYLKNIDEMTAILEEDLAKNIKTTMTSEFYFQFGCMETIEKEIQKGVLSEEEILGIISYQDCSEFTKTKVAENAIVNILLPDDDIKSSPNCVATKRSDIQGPYITKVSENIYDVDVQVPLSCGMSWEVIFSPNSCSIEEINSTYVE